jgi:hypothetical protein
MPDDINRPGRTVGYAEWMKSLPLRPRAQFLLVLGLGWMVFGLGLVFDPPATDPHSGIFYEALPAWFRGGLWITSGVLGALGSIRPNAHTWGFVAVMAMPLERMLGFLGAWLLSLFTDGGTSSAWVQASIWAVVVLIIRICAEWLPEVPRGRCRD